MSSSQTPECVLFGGYAGGTVGDEVALAVAIERARSDFGESFAVLTRDPAYTKRLFPEVNAIAYTPRRGPSSHGRFRRLARLLGFGRGDEPPYFPDGQHGEGGQPQPWVEAVRGCRILYLVGGGYLNDVWETNYTLLPIWLAADAGVAISSAPIQIGPYASREALQRTALVLKDSNLRVRDRTSLALAESLHLSAEGAIDDVFAFPTVMPELARSTLPNRARPRIGVCIFRQNGAPQPEFDDWWLRFLRELNRSSEVDLEGFAFHNYDGYDSRDTRELFTMAGVDASAVLPSPTEFRGALAGVATCDAVITCRFHAAVVAAVLGIPTFAFASGEYYAAKLTAFWPEGVEPFHTVTPASVPEEAALEVVEAACRK